jgi:hypothetical protein
MQSRWINDADSGDDFKLGRMDRTVLFRIISPYWSQPGSAASRLVCARAAKRNGQVDTHVRIGQLRDKLAVEKLDYRRGGGSYAAVIDLSSGG